MNYLIIANKKRVVLWKTILVNPVRSLVIHTCDIGIFNNLRHRKLLTGSILRKAELNNVIPVAVDQKKADTCRLLIQYAIRFCGFYHRIPQARLR